MTTTAAAIDGVLDAEQLQASFNRQRLRLFRPPPKLSVSQWSDRYRILSRESSAEPGRWRTARAPYQRGIMDAISDPSVEEVVLVKPSQVGFTEMLGNVVG